ncbi:MULTISPECIES: hypothetical protein [unclassified Brevibacterium]|uniref:hypothetical protein n=1 Tax=unclassified Brevibacterium TaxID=2614124 RepID=UPI00363BFDC5
MPIVIGIVDTGRVIGLLSAGCFPGRSRITLNLADRIPIDRSPLDRSLLDRSLSDRRLRRRWTLSFRYGRDLLEEFGVDAAGEVESGIPELVEQRFRSSGRSTRAACG